jgi:hypothetical protein
MNVTTINASVKLSKQLPGQECWKTIELGAEAGLDAGQDWKIAQSQLYIHLTQQLKTLWGEAKVAAPPASNIQKLHHTEQQAAAPPAPVPAGDAQQPACPKHNGARPSKRGGLYCPGTNPDGSYCQWTWQPEKKAKVNGRK